MWVDVHIIYMNIICCSNNLSIVKNQQKCTFFTVWMCVLFVGVLDSCGGCTPCESSVLISVDLNLLMSIPWNSNPLFRIHRCPVSFVIYVSFSHSHMMSLCSVTDYLSCSSIQTVAAALAHLEALLSINCFSKSASLSICALCTIKQSLKKIPSPSAVRPMYSRLFHWQWPSTISSHTSSANNVAYSAMCEIRTSNMRLKYSLVFFPLSHV